MPRLHGASKSILFAKISDPYEVRPRLHGANIALFIAQILESYEVTQSKIAQIKVTLFALVNKALLCQNLLK